MARPTPADVGRRISLRYRIPGDGQSEAVGTLQSWADGELVVRRRDGSDLRIGEQLVVAARLVPDPPARGAGAAAPARGTESAELAKGPGSEGTGPAGQSGPGPGSDPG